MKYRLWGRAGLLEIVRLRGVKLVGGWCYGGREGKGLRSICDEDDVFIGIRPLFNVCIMNMPTILFYNKRDFNSILVVYISLKNMKNFMFHLRKFFFGPHWYNKTIP